MRRQPYNGERRLATLVYTFKDLSDVASEWIREMGVDVPYQHGFSDYAEFYKRCELKFMLDSVTVAHKFLVKKLLTGIQEPRAPGRYRDEVRRIFAEENVASRSMTAGEFTTKSMPNMRPIGK